MKEREIDNLIHARILRNPSEEVPRYTEDAGCDYAVLRRVSSLASFEVDLFMVCLYDLLVPRYRCCLKVPVTALIPESLGLVAFYLPGDYGKAALDMMGIDWRNSEEDDDLGMIEEEVETSEVTA